MLGVVAGLGVVLAIVLWERMAFPGLFNFSAVYRVTAWFWEMHVGGAAIDAYLALAGPFVLLFWVKARSRALRGLAAILLFLLAYAVLVTFSRGLYAGAVVSVLVFVLVMGLARRADSRGNRPPVSVARQGAQSRMRRVALPLVAAGVVGWLALGADSFLVNRLLNTERVWAGRLDHWAQAIALVRTPADWLFGVGLGRFPARYAASVVGGDFSGAVHVSDRAAGESGGRTFVTLQGPIATDEKGGLFALTQRISPAPGARYLATGKYRAAVETDLVLQVCERHLLYNWNCQEAGFRTDPQAPGWQDFSLILQGERFSTPALQVPRLAFFTVSVVNAGGQTDLTDMQLAQGEQAGLLLNADFSAGTGRWFPAAQYYFEPWHADSLLLDLLVERGLAGLLALAALLLAAAKAVVRLQRRDAHYAACLSASLAGALVVGMVSSVLDVPRVAFLLYFVMFYSLVCGGQPSGAPMEPGKVQPKALP